MVISMVLAETIREPQQIRFIAAWVWNVKVWPVPLLRLHLVPEALTLKWWGVVWPPSLSNSPLYSV